MCDAFRENFQLDEKDQTMERRSKRDRNPLGQNYQDHTQVLKLNTEGFNTRIVASHGIILIFTIS